MPVAKSQRMGCPGPAISSPVEIQAAWKRAQLRAIHHAPKPARRKSAMRAMSAIKSTAPVIVDEDFPFDGLIFQSLNLEPNPPIIGGKSEDEDEVEHEMRVKTPGDASETAQSPSKENFAGLLWNKHWQSLPDDVSPPPSPHRQMLDSIAEEELRPRPDPKYTEDQIYDDCAINMLVFNRAIPDFQYTRFQDIPWPILTQNPITNLTMVQEVHVVRFYSNGNFENCDAAFLRVYQDMWDPMRFAERQPNKFATEIREDVFRAMTTVHETLAFMVRKKEQIERYPQWAANSLDENSDEDDG